LALLSTTRNANTRASTIARRGIFTKKACGYVDDRRRRPVPLPPLPKQSRYKRDMLAFAHIPTGPAADKGFEIDDVNRRLVHPAVALTRSEPTSKQAGLHYSKRLRLSHVGVHLTYSASGRRDAPGCSRRRQSGCPRRRQMKIAEFSGHSFAECGPGSRRINVM
jgi:hypothetical protein